MAKIIAPKLRERKEDPDWLKDFVEEDADPGSMDNADPGLVMNPVLLYRMQVYKAQQDARARKKFIVRSAGLARLGLNVTNVELPKEERSVQEQVTPPVQTLVIIGHMPSTLPSPPLPPSRPHHSHHASTLTPVRSRILCPAPHPLSGCVFYPAFA